MKNFLMKTFLLFVAVGACARHPKDLSYGDTALTCGTADHGVSTCVGGGRTFKCVSPSEGCEGQDWQCAPWEGH